MVPLPGLEQSIVTAGMNEVGLTCDMQVLDGTQYPAKLPSLRSVNVLQLCDWALSLFSTVNEGVLRHAVACSVPCVCVCQPRVVSHGVRMAVKRAVHNVSFWGEDMLPMHFSARDATGCAPPAQRGALPKPRH